MVKALRFDGSSSPQELLLSFDSDVLIHSISSAGIAGNVVATTDLGKSFYDIWTPAQVDECDDVLCALYLSHQQNFVTPVELRKGNSVKISVDGSAVVLVDYTNV